MMCALTRVEIVEWYAATPLEILECRISQKDLPLAAYIVECSEELFVAINRHSFSTTITCEHYGQHC